MLKRIELSFLLCIPFILSAKDPKMIDFSYAGYEGGGVSKPKVETLISLLPTGKDDSRLIQNALIQLAQMPLQASGYRGAIEFSADTFRVAENIHVEIDGVVLRGTAAAGRQSTLLATGTSRRTLFELGIRTEQEGDTVSIVADAELGAMAVQVASVEGFALGDRITVIRSATQAWLSSVRMGGEDSLRWDADQCEMLWDRTIVRVNVAQRTLWLDAPLTMALELRYGGATIVKRNEPMRHFIMENLVLDSEFDTLQIYGENHAWNAIQTDYLEDAFFDHVTVRHFANAGFHLGRRTRRVTLRWCDYQSPVSEVDEYRRIPYLIDGQQVLAYCCLSERGLCDFAAGHFATGPNVFLTCIAAGSNGASGGYGAWATGFLYEDTHIQYSTIFLGYDNFRLNVGWNMANSVIWNCSADYIDVNGAPDAANRVGSSHKSIYLNQLSSRKGKGILKSLTE